MDRKTLLEILRQETVPATGCTEPAAAALAGAKARETAGTDSIVSARIKASKNMMKNAMGVSIPGCEKKGIAAAVALGIAVGDTSKGLGILSELNEKTLKAASALNTEISIADNTPPLFIEVTVETQGGHSCSVTVSDKHDRFSKIVADGKTLSEAAATETADLKPVSPGSITLHEIIDFANTVSVAHLDFLKTAVETNYRISVCGMDRPFGLQVGRTMADKPEEKPSDSDKAFRLASCYAVAGSDARMSGCPMPVYINSGSGNQGIITTVPLKILGEFLNAGEEKILRAVCISSLTALMLAEKKNRLSALCGAFTASIGTACAYMYLLGGSEKAINEVVNIMIADLTGIICDGAKPTCPLKIFSCLETAAMAVRLILKGKITDDEYGIVGSTYEESISHLSEISTKGMEETDRTIYSIMLGKENLPPC